MCVAHGVAIESMSIGFGAYLVVSPGWSLGGSETGFVPA